MNKIVILFAILFSFGLSAQEETKYDTSTASVKKQRAMGYPLSVLEEIPVVKGCEALAENKAFAAKCMKDQFNFLFAPFMEGIDKHAKDKGASVYVEFTINEDNSISVIERLKISEPDLDEFVRDAFTKFRRKIIQEKIIVKPGRIYDRDVKTLYGVRFITSFKDRNTAPPQQ